MSSKSKHGGKRSGSSNTNGHLKKAAPASPKYPDTIWTPFIEYNNLPPPLRKDALEELGIFETDKEVLGILTKSHFVIPGLTRFQCTQCGECCRYARKVAQLTYEPCPFLTADNRCAKHDNHYNVCKWFPFWIYRAPHRAPLLTIKPYCPGYGEGPLVDYQETVKRLEKLALDESHVNDGAFVIHEVLYIPGYRDWMFPSKANIDALMEHIRAEQMKTVSEKATEMPPRRPGEVNYAQHITSGLIGSNNSPLLTANQLGQITDVNEVACEKIGIEAAGLIGRDLSAFFVNPDRIIACLKSCFARGKETASPHRLKLPDGSTTPVLLDGMTYRDRTDGFVHSVLLCINPVSPASYAEFNQSRNYARGLLEASLDALMVIDKDGVITDVNEAVVLVTGLPRESLLGSPFMSLFSDPDKAQQGVQKTFAEGIVRNYVLMLLSTSGEQIPVSFNATIYQDTDGVVQGIFAAARDIRERLKMMHELEEAKTYARGLIECCLDLMVTINREGIITDANRAAAVMTGHPHEAIIGTPFRNFFDDSERAQAGVDQTFRDGEVRNYTMNLRTAESNLIPVSFNATLYRDPFGTVQGVFAIARSQA